MEPQEASTADLFYQAMVERLGEGAEDRLRLFVRNGDLMDVLCRIMLMIVRRAELLFSGLQNGLLAQDLMRQGLEHSEESDDPHRIVLRSRGKELSWAQIDAAYRAVEQDPNHGSRMTSVVARRLGVSPTALSGCADREGIPRARMHHRRRSTSL